ncbi:MAG: signal peptidase I [Deltaproteobacteria bacterium]|jgi:signal peptidase I|nr:signal peptidase I [Deltaproteobacteria bacterium]
MTKKPVWREYLEALFVAFFLAMLIRSFVMQAYQIPSGSMLNTLLIGDKILVNRLSYNLKLPLTDKVLVRLGDPDFGDVIVFTYPDPDPDRPRVDYVKRVIGLPGDVIESHDNQIYRNGNKIDEPYARFTKPAPAAGPYYYLSPAPFVRGTPRDFAPLTIPEDSYFVMGDNRDDSQDSRYWGFVRREAVHGKAWRVYWSWGGAPGDAGSSAFPQTGPRWSRIGHPVQ